MRRLPNRLIISITILAFFNNCQSDQEPPVVQGENIDSFAALIEAVADADSLEQLELISGFVDSLDFPLIENGSTVYFLYQGDANSVSVAGDFTGWDPRGRGFEKLKDSDLWYREESFEDNARLDYKLVINGSSWILDPRNPNRIGGGFGPNSELAMPQYEQPWEVVENAEVQKGTVENFDIPSSFTGKSYRVYVYLPHGYSAENQYPVAYFQDGLDYLSLAQSATVMDNLIDAGEIQPLIGVFVVPNDRNVEYAFGDRFKYTSFFVSELVPYLDSNYSTMPTKEKRAVIGDSYGGNISAIIAFQNPEIFGNCGIHSGAFQPNNFSTNSIVMDGVKKEIKVATIWGTYEGASLPPNMRRVKDYLVEENYEVYWKELPEGHSWGLWRATQDDMLKFFFPAE
ncbi:MAG: hypothetical protein HRT61_08695 [Ekhidna sp.]|nr:hypothetical protein [Ekhidna sp.]